MSESNMAILLTFPIQPLVKGFIIFGNIRERPAIQKLGCCDAAKRILHGFGKK
jgi:hypothetical protein